MRGTGWGDRQAFCIYFCLLVNLRSIRAGIGLVGMCLRSIREGIGLLGMCLIVVGVASTVNLRGMKLAAARCGAMPCTPPPTILFVGSIAAEGQASFWSWSHCSDSSMRDGEGGHKSIQCDAPAR